MAFTVAETLSLVTSRSPTLDLSMTGNAAPDIPSALSTAENHLYLVDGSGYIFRAFHALPQMNRSDGTPTNAVFGFTTMLMKLVEDLEADHLAVIFDTKRLTFRNDIFPTTRPIGMSRQTT